MKHRDDLLKGKWDNPALDALFNKIRTEHEGYEYPDGSTFQIGTREGPNAPGQKSTVDTHTFRRTHYETDLRYHFAQRTPNYIIVT